MYHDTASMHEHTETFIRKDTQSEILVNHGIMYKFFYKSTLMAGRFLFLNNVPIEVALRVLGKNQFRDSDWHVKTNL